VAERETLELRSFLDPDREIDVRRSLLSGHGRQSDRWPAYNEMPCRIAYRANSLRRPTSREQFLLFRRLLRLRAGGGRTPMLCNEVVRTWLQSPTAVPAEQVKRALQTSMRRLAAGDKRRLRQAAARLACSRILGDGEVSPRLRRTFSDAYLNAMTRGQFDPAPFLSQGFPRSIEGAPFNLGAELVAITAGIFATGQQRLASVTAPELDRVRLLYLALFGQISDSDIGRVASLVDLEPTESLELRNAVEHDVTSDIVWLVGLVGLVAEIPDELWDALQAARGERAPVAFIAHIRVPQDGANRAVGSAIGNTVRPAQRRGPGGKRRPGRNP
jgi:hypothetical protein